MDCQRKATKIQCPRIQNQGTTDFFVIGQRFTYDSLLIIHGYPTSVLNQRLGMKFCKQNHAGFTAVLKPNSPQHTVAVLTDHLHLITAKNDQMILIGTECSTKRNGALQFHLPCTENILPVVRQRADKCC